MAGEARRGSNKGERRRDKNEQVQGERRRDKNEQVQGERRMKGSKLAAASLDQNKFQSDPPLLTVSILPSDVYSLKLDDQPSRIDYHAIARSMLFLAPKASSQSSCGTKDGVLEDACKAAAKISSPSDAPCSFSQGQQDQDTALPCAAEATSVLSVNRGEKKKQMIVAKDPSSILIHEDGLIGLKPNFETKNIRLIEPKASSASCWRRLVADETHGDILKASEASLKNLIEPKPLVKHVHFDDCTTLLLVDKDVSDGEKGVEEGAGRHAEAEGLMNEDGELGANQRPDGERDYDGDEVESSKRMTRRRLYKKRVRKKRYTPSGFKLPKIDEEDAEDSDRRSLVSDLRSALTFLRQNAWTSKKIADGGGDGQGRESEAVVAQGWQEGISDKEYEHVSSGDASWCCGADMVLREHDEKLEGVRSVWDSKFVEEMELAEEESVRGPFSGGHRSLVLYVCNVTSLPLVLAAHETSQRCRWPMQPPAKIDPGKQVCMACETRGSLFTLIDGSVTYKASLESGLSQFVSFTVRWQTAVGAWIKYSSSSAQGWGVEREYRKGNQGRHIVTRCFFTRKFSPMSLGLRDLTLGGRELGFVMLDTSLDERIASRFHCTTERTAAISAWLKSLLEGSHAHRLHLVILLGVHAQDSKTSLMNTLAGEMGFHHLLSHVGPRSLGITRDSGILVASRHPLLWQSFAPFPKHEGCSHPALALPRGAYGGVASMLVDVTSVGSLADSHFQLLPGMKLLLSVTSLPAQPLLHSAATSALLEAIKTCSSLGGEGSMGLVLCGKFESYPLLRLPHADSPRLILRDLYPSNHADCHQRLPSVGALSGSDKTNTWDRFRNSLAASACENKQGRMGASKLEGGLGGGVAGLEDQVAEAAATAARNLKEVRGCNDGYRRDTRLGEKKQCREGLAT
ncbi:hypothetical protein GUITHDRAFT_140815 [Guillardia theta CCMP2712]|uniref:Uncharacterized protein n=1 Tax=Guillardia theta (strain CCMP2712) TaxID=905079 RepID=L1J347_GUITC|nr:hypothetical protein GUITHDRAFT_140815 [Guillardia theta CCMP2712]EKX42948.1 hypothetical protein GUITHDRAFT_140815 [Guillardia theta CCMP2712]|eukprot:XP_005829928.1 hypothetical protein GUITHDRAFT_140815 [Guillardia theta CCMP2712]